ncbi:phosphoethanolamine transferase [Megasphaera paucivorans]|uniref:Heptose-I-phosphate ethanolaminephosphotransferase n=1 Tax=Megasphaera paucivorans TaxID=349095 RepID=A0A1G9ZC67_9FIRM|nr:phosphoethanolamine transferase [Megasphaera paucivorans]SDN18687.1 heptose-I-phosphate ethanolaminephosphotransferase [Megasphaera paucivorans]
MPRSTIARRIFYLFCIFLVIYVLCFQWELLISLGLGEDNIKEFTFGLIPAVAAVTLALALYWENISIASVIPTAIIGISWIVTGPLLNFSTLVKSNTIYLNNIYDVYVGLYVFAIVFCINMLMKQHLPQKTGTFLMTLVQMATLLIPAVQWVYYALYQSCITTSGALLIYQTNPAEMLEYFHSLGYSKLFFIIIALAAIISVFAKANCHRIHCSGLSWKPKIIALLSLIIIFPSFYALGSEIFPECFPIRLFLDTRDYMNRSSLYAENHDAKFAELQAVQLHKPDHPHTVIVVIGESETRTLMNAYNPSHVENTPWLTAEKNNPQFTLFNNVYSCVWYTVPVLEHALTESNFYNNKEFNESISIIDMAKKIGYKTYWFSNQGSVGVADTPITLVANTADNAEWTDRDLKESCHDDALLGFLQRVNPNENNFIVLHLMGSHIEYRNRYPSEFQRFDDGKINEEADFDNTVLYTDWILSQIFEYGREHLNLDAMVYFSDHGSDPLEGRKPDETGFKVLRIPMFCYVSPDYIERNPVIADTLKAHQNSFFTNDLEYEFICGILNIQSPNYDPSYSLASPAWKMKRQDLVTRFGQTSLMDDKEF